MVRLLSPAVLPSPRSRTSTSRPRMALLALDGTVTTRIDSSLEAIGRLEGAVAEFPRECLPALLGRLEKLKALVWVRLYVEPRNSDVEEHLLTADEAAARLQVPKTHLYRKRYPFTVRLSPGRVRFSSSGINRFIQRRAQNGHSST
jgi:predicted DNA-binding transcriptional regulator AlpA